MSSPDKKLVLIVDDTPTNVAVVSGVLKDSFRTKVATNGEKALAIANSAEKPDLILLDVTMPGMDGYEVCRRLRQSGLVHALIVAMTGYGLERDRRRSQEAGFDTHMVKPVPPGELMRLIANHAGASTRADVGRPEPGRSPASG